VTFSITSQQNCRPKVVNWLIRSRNTLQKQKLTQKYKESWIEAQERLKKVRREQREMQGGFR
jgi:hypothetical protein